MLPKTLMMALLLGMGAHGVLQAQDSLKVVNWNLEYFGDQAQNPPRQVGKVITLMQHINADVYALEEIVDVDSIKKVKASLGADYEVLVSPFGSVAPDSLSPNYPAAQKLAFLYRKSRVKVLSSRPYMVSSSTAYYNFATGRMPFLVKTLVRTTDTSQWRPLNFYVVHAKAMSDNQSCNRRTAAAMEWKDSLDKNAVTEPFILLGDFNDDLDYSICGGSSNYLNFVNDSLGNNYYFSPTLAPSILGVNSINGYTSFLDHVILSDEVKPWYLTNSVKVLEQEVNNWVTNYNADVSDHFPVATYYRIPSTPSAILDPAAIALSIFPNPAHDFFRIQTQGHALNRFLIRDMMGREVLKGALNNTSTTISIQDWPSGIYGLQCWGDKDEKVQQKIIVLH